MAKDKTLIVDVDGVLRNIYVQILNIYNRDIDPDRRVRYADIRQYDFKDAFPDVEDPYSLFFRTYAAEVFLFAPPYEDVQSVMEALYQEYYIHIVTAQLKGNEGYTIDWLHRYSIPYDAVTFSSRKSNIQGDIFLDDSVYNLQNAPGGSLPVCMDQPWNQEWEFDRVKNMVEFMEFLESIKNVV